MGIFTGQDSREAFDWGEYEAYLDRTLHAQMFDDANAELNEVGDKVQGELPYHPSHEFDMAFAGCIRCGARPWWDIAKRPCGTCGMDE